MQIRRVIVVGYAGDAMVNGFRSVGAQFVTVGTVEKGFYLSGATVTGADQFTASVNPVELQTLKSDGTMDLTYTYHKGDTGRSYKNFDGWYSGTKPVQAGTDTDVFFPIGTGLWLSSSEKLSLVTTAEVVMDSIQCDLTSGFKLIANPYPVAVKLSSIEILGADQYTASVNPIELQTLKPDGTMELTYTYHKGDTGRSYKNFDGWYSGTKPVQAGTETEVLIPAGGAVWVNATGTQFKIKIPTPFEDAE